MSELFLKDLVPIVELQAIELKRLLRDKERLGRKVESLIREIGQLRETQQQALVVRQKDQALQAQLQDTIATLLADSPAPVPTTGAGKGADDLDRAPPRGDVSAKTTLVRASEMDRANRLTAADQSIGIPSFLIGSDVANASSPEPPIRKLLTRIRARSDAG